MTVADYSAYDGKMVRVTDTDGRVFTGFAEAQSADWCFHVLNRDEAGIEVNGYTLFAADIAELRPMPNLAVIRATETWQRAGAYYVRIQAMAKKHHIALRQEFDAHDGPDTRYIVVTDDDFPIATARMYELDGASVMIGRVVVLPEYRLQGIGTMVVRACEAWAEETNHTRAVVESRENKIGFYEQMDYEITGEAVDGDTFRCVRMEKDL